MTEAPWPQKPRLHGKDMGFLWSLKWTSHTGWLAHAHQIRSSHHIRRLIVERPLARCAATRKRLSRLTASSSESMIRAWPLLDLAMDQETLGAVLAMAPWQLCLRAYAMLPARGLRWGVVSWQRRLPFLDLSKAQHNNPSLFTDAYCDFFFIKKAHLIIISITHAFGTLSEPPLSR